MAISSAFDLIISLLSGAGTAISPFVLIWLTKGQKDIHEKIDEVSQQVKESQQNDLKILKARLRTDTERILKKGSLTYAELDSLEDLFKAYSSMGGNGIVEQNMVKIRLLPVKGD